MADVLSIASGKCLATLHMRVGFPCGVATIEVGQMVSPSTAEEQGQVC